MSREFWVTSWIGCFLKSGSEYDPWTDVHAVVFIYSLFACLTTPQTIFFLRCEAVIYEKITILVHTSQLCANTYCVMFLRLLDIIPRQLSFDFWILRHRRIRERDFSKKSIWESVEMNLHNRLLLFERGVVYTRVFIHVSKLVSYLHYPIHTTKLHQTRSVCTAQELGRYQLNICFHCSTWVELCNTAVERSYRWLRLYFLRTMTQYIKTFSHIA